MRFRNLVLGLWVVNYVDPLATGEPVDGGRVLVVPNLGDVYEISGLPNEPEWAVAPGWTSGCCGRPSCTSCFS